MKNFAIAALAAITLPTASNAAGIAIISEIVDAPLPGGLPKFVEITNVGDAVIDMSSIHIGNFSNGSTNLGGDSTTALSGSLVPGDSYVVSYENGDSPGAGLFFDTYGFDPDFFDLGAFINGDDVVAIFDGPATGDGTDANIIDIYGVIGTDGTGEVWEYTDGFSFRKPGEVVPGGTFSDSQWTIGGANSLETGDDVEELALILANTSPGTHGAAVPEPASVLLSLLGVGFILRRRR